MKTGDILACRGKHLLAKLIMGFTNSYYSHVAIVVIIQEKVYVVEMQRTGCDLISFENWQKKYNYEFDVFEPIDPVSIREILSKASITKYDLRSLLIRQPIKIIKEKLFKKTLTLKKVRNEDSKMTCSEFIAYLYGMEPYYDMTPDDIVKECISRNYKQSS